MIYVMIKSLLTLTALLLAGASQATEIYTRKSIDAAIAPALPAVEKCWATSKTPGRVLTRLTVGPQARIEWLPQETILFDHARLSRRLDACMAENGSLSIFEAVVFGRATRSEIMSGAVNASIV